MTPEERRHLQQELSEVASRLMEFHTVKERPQAIEQCMAFIKSYFEGTSANIREHKINEKPALFVSFNKKKRQTLIFNGHIDVVEGSESQFSPYVEKGRLFGRGSVDMKGAVAAFMVLMKKLSRMKHPPPVGLMIVSDEETDGLCSKRMVSHGYAADFVIVGEPTRMQVETRHKGHMTVAIYAYGSASHGSRPWQGKNAIIKLWNQYQKFADAVPQAKRSSKWFPTINPTSIIADAPHNVTPSKARMILDIRTTEDYTNDSMFALLRKLKIRYKRIVSINMLTNPRRAHIRPFKLYAQRFLGRKLKYVKSCGGSDAKAFSDKGMEAINFGPVGKNHHRQQEYVDLNSLVDYYRVLDGYVKNYICK
ncbi:MAG: M20 family metallopeptidase [DPANN group archaeon]|nr:M20 family metallopeptidase [DPANN group archaeon]